MIMMINHPAATCLLLSVVFTSGHFFKSVDAVNIRGAGIDQFFCGCAACTIDIWNGDACRDDLGGCHTCGSRIDYLKGLGQTEAQACTIVSEQFSNGPCGPVCNPNVCNGTPELTRSQTKVPTVPPSHGLSNQVNVTNAATATMRSFNFDVQVKYAPLLRSIPNHTAIYHQWPPKALRKTLPAYISAAVVVTKTANESFDDNASDSDLPLVGPPIHVQEGDTLFVTLKNSLSTTGLSIHWHGFEMKNALEYDGVVGVTQCPISPYTQFTYEFEVNETPGTYWWHTHSGTLGVHAINSIHGPLIVHPKGQEKKNLVDKLNGSFNGTSEEIKSQWYYEEERILFFKDGFIHPDALHLAHKLGGLNEAVSKDDSGNTVSTSAWEFGTCNGRMREIVPVSPGRTYKFRLINGGVHHGLRINIANLNMKIVAADSEPVEPVDVNEVFLHSAERFDVEVTIPNDWVKGQSFWIRADTIESAYQGYENGIRAILKISSDHDHDVTEHSNDVYDPIDSIKSPVERSHDHLTMNCFNRATFDGAPNGGHCLPITTLSRSQASLNRKNESYIEKEEIEAEVHFIDSHFQPYPQFSHFIRFDDGPFVQHVNPMKAMLDSPFGLEDMHPNTNVLHVPAYSTVLLVWRSTSLMDHPMHLHGPKMSIIDIALPNKRQDCTLAKCKLNSYYESHEDVRALAASIQPHTSVLKDTFILPAGGAVVTRIHTQEPALWYSHCHLEMHHFDGMAFILNVGNYSGSERALPQDYPSCESPFLQGHTQYPSCDCYENPNAILSTSLTADYKCSRDHLCHHVFSRPANLEKYHFVGGDAVHSAYEAVPGYAISLISLALVCLGWILTLMRYPKTVSKSQRVSNLDLASSFSKGEDSHTQTAIPSAGEKWVESAVEQADSSPHFMKQLIAIIRAQYMVYKPLCVNFLRLIEVCTLGILTGFLYYDVGNNNSYTGLSEKLGLFFFSTTLWTFTRMYPSVGFSHQWWSLLSQVELKRRSFIGFGPVVLGRLLVVLSLESFWPLLYVLVCFPFAGVFGSIKIVILVGLFLLLNNLCYISMGSILGVYSKQVSTGMIASTIFSQTSLVAAGFYTKLPPALDWIRYISPFYWSFRGILKSSFQWHDTVECFKGSSEVGANQCFLEFHPVIAQYKERGINVATYNDSSSDSISLEFAALILLLFILNFLIYAKAWFICKSLKRQADHVGLSGKDDIVAGGVQEEDMDKVPVVQQEGEEQINQEKRKSVLRNRRTSARSSIGATSLGAL